MTRKSITWLLGVGLLLGPAALLAQQHLPYDTKLTEPDQELDDLSGGFAGIHRMSAQRRGVQGLHHTVYWVNADGQRLTAYKSGRQAWQANVAQAFANVLPGATIKRLVLSSGFVFVFTDRRGHAEIDRATGNVSAVGVDPE
ncbi:hypothetical protein HHL22_10370 [Hymenobacter sp. RP-2-7]|uniref:Uncharacterized protein n=1 Tax=Hymenobacter polaris TaxID=2682546 RepID=A0A7Y0FMM5_9BACT|nr:hypothetical protein [Hymenobacter polaris]NML65610.1 hypothetical protein [Hymenobacter polaris]